MFHSKIMQFLLMVLMCASIFAMSALGYYLLDASSFNIILIELTEELTGRGDL